mgnify:CR=1 FL=1
MSAHTPGPWTIKEPVKAIGDERMDFAIVAEINGRPRMIAETFWRVGTSLFAPAETNARLIAAAPRMLELLKLAQVRIFMLDGANVEYEAIDALLTDLGVTNK